MKMLPRQTWRERTKHTLCVSASEMSGVEPQLITNIQHLISHTIGVICHPSPCSRSLCLWYWCWCWCCSSLFRLFSVVASQLIYFEFYEKVFWCARRALSLSLRYYFSERIKIRRTNNKNNNKKMPGWKIAHGPRFKNRKNRTGKINSHFSIHKTLWTEHKRRISAHTAHAIVSVYRERTESFSLGPFVRFSHCVNWWQLKLRII